MTHLLQNILAILTVLVLIVAVFFPTSNQAYTVERILDKVSVGRVEAVSTLEQANQSTQEVEITSVEQISDVSPDEPYFNALKKFIELYQMDVTLPDGSFKGDKSITRGDFIIYLRDSLEVIINFIERASIANVTSDELETAEAVITDKKAETAVISQKIEEIKTRLDKLESKINASEQSLLVKAVAALSWKRNQAPSALARVNTTTEDISKKQVSQSPQKINLLAQVNRIEQIPDISTDDFYYDALREIIEDYGIDVTLPDSTFKGNQAITRGEVIIYLHDSIAKVEEFIAPEEAEARNRELELRFDKLSSQIAEGNVDFADKLAQIEEIEAQLDKLERRIEQDDKS